MTERVLFPAIFTNHPSSPVQFSVRSQKPPSPPQNKFDASFLSMLQYLQLSFVRSICALFRRKEFSCKEQADRNYGKSVYNQ